MWLNCEIESLASRWFQSFEAKQNKPMHIFSALQIISRVIKWYLFMVLSRTFTGGRTHMLLNRHILIEMSEWATTDNISVCRFLPLSAKWFRYRAIAVEWVCSKCTDTLSYTDFTTIFKKDPNTKRAQRLLCEKLNSINQIAFELDSC